MVRSSPAQANSRSWTRLLKILVGTHFTTPTAWNTPWKLPWTMAPRTTPLVTLPATRNSMAAYATFAWRSKPRAITFPYRRTYLADDLDTLREKAGKTPFGRLDASMQRGLPCAHEISLTAHLASEGFPQQLNREQIRELSYFATFARNKNCRGVPVQRFRIEYSVFGDQPQPIAAADGARQASLSFVAAA